jgi:hypothetical protein
MEGGELELRAPRWTIAERPVSRECRLDCLKSEKIESGADTRDDRRGSQPFRPYVPISAIRAESFAATSLS